MNLQENDLQILGDFILKVLKPQFDQIDRRFENLEGKINYLQNDVADIQSDVNSLREDLEKLGINLRYEIKQLDLKIDSTATLIIRNTIADHTRINNLEKQSKKMNAKLGIE